MSQSPSSRRGRGGLVMALTGRARTGGMDGWLGCRAGVGANHKPQAKAGGGSVLILLTGWRWMTGGCCAATLELGRRVAEAAARERRIERSMAPAGATFGWTLRLHGIGLVGMRLCYCASRLSVTLASFGGCGRSLVCGDELALPTSWPNGSSQARGGPGLGRRVSRVS